MSLHIANNWSEVQTRFNEATEDGARVKLNFSTASGNSSASWNAPPNAVLFGLGLSDLSNYGGGDLTVITDDFASNNALLSITANATGKFRAYGFSLIGGSGDLKDSGPLVFDGLCKKFHLDHIHLDNNTYSILGSRPLMRISGYLNGVIDRSVFDPYGISNCIVISFDGADADQQGDTSWASDTGLGGVDFVYHEDNIFNKHLTGAKSNLVFGDINHGGKAVYRYNVGSQGSVQTHPTGGAGTARGARAWEIYLNNFDGSDPTTTNFNNAFISSGTGVVWGNSSVRGGDNFLTLHSMRRHSPLAGGSYTQIAPPDGLGYSGPAYQTGTVNTSGTTVTKTAGSNFSLSWTANSMIIINGTSYSIASVSSTTVLTLQQSAGTQTGVGYVIGSNIDGNTDAVTGWPCCDAPGQGKGDLLTGSYPTKLNSATGGGPLNANFNPRQALEPVYEWLNNYTCITCDQQVFWSVFEPDALIENRDYYLYKSGAFDGTVGVGSGTFAQMTAFSSAADGTAFWVTDRGSWNRQTNNYYLGQGQLWKRVAGVWTFFYEPHQYPHELVLEDESGGSISTTQLLLMGEGLT